MSPSRNNEPQLFVGVTDSEWYRFLRDRPELDEVNFWQPGGGRGFRTLKLGEPFLFKLKAPDNFVAGGAFFRHYSKIPVSLAWDTFGEKNGAPSYAEMRRLIEKHRDVIVPGRDDYTIGCIILGDPFFLRRDDWIPTPSEFSREVVSGKTFALNSEPGRGLWADVLARLASSRTRGIGESLQREIPGPIFGDPRVTVPRLGQGAFRIMVTDAYSRQCAISRERALPALQAAHIRSIADGGRHRLDNGLLLRSDMHGLFDDGYITVTPEHRVLVAKQQLKEDFDNGEPYHPFHGERIALPAEQAHRPAREFLEWHSDTVFRG